MEVGTGRSGQGHPGLALRLRELGLDLPEVGHVGEQRTHAAHEAEPVRAEGGVLWSEINRETQLHGLAVTGGMISTTGIAGLTLGGGLGWLMSKHGLAADNLVSAEVVTADGSVVTASADEHDDLFWALRGGGGNFGVVTAFTFKMHPVNMAYAGPMLWDISEAEDVAPISLGQHFLALDIHFLAIGNN